MPDLSSPFGLLLTLFLGLGVLGWGIRKIGFSIQGDRLNIRVRHLGFNWITALANALFQTRLLVASPRRWAGHFMVFAGFVYLLVFHAMDEWVSFKLFDYYQPTLNPHQFLRNLAGFLVLVGCGGFILRRWRQQDRHPVTHRRILGVGKKRDFILILLVFLSVATGFVLEAAKIVSEPVFDEMVSDYADMEEGRDLNDLRALWYTHHQVVFEVPPLVTSQGLENGEQLNQEFCMDCHARPQSAFLSSALARPFSGFAKGMAQWRGDLVLYWVHCLSVFSLLFFLPFTRLSHVILIPLATGAKKLAPGSWKKFEDQGILLSPAALAACTRCGLCSTVCNVYPHAKVRGDEWTLPHVKVARVADLARGKAFSPGNIQRLFDANDQCTRCGECTRICPSGIDLQGVWMSLPPVLEKMGALAPVDGVTQLKFGDRKHPVLDTGENEPRVTTQLTKDSHSFEACVQCTVCSNVCPVTAHGVGDVTPHQVMNLLRLENYKAARASSMVWSCLSCYSCQEHCPQQIPVTDIMLELRHRAHGAVAQSTELMIELKGEK